MARVGRFDAVGYHGFVTVASDGELGNVVDGVDEFPLDAKNGTLPAVSGIVPANQVSEHPPNGVAERARPA